MTVLASPGEVSSFLDIPAQPSIARTLAMLLGWAFGPMGLTLRPQQKHFSHLHVRQLFIFFKAEKENRPLPVRGRQRALLLYVYRTLLHVKQPRMFSAC